MLVIGIDPSLVCTSIATCCDGDVLMHRATSKSAKDDSCLARLKRYEGLVSQVVDVVMATKALSGDVPCRIFIEGYSFGSKFARETLGEFGGLLRFYLLDHDPELVEVPPTTLKKFATGKGNAKKEQVMQSVLKNWGYESASNDDADAYALCRLGMCVCGLDEPKNVVQRAVVAQMKF